MKLAKIRMTEFICSIDDTRSKWEVGPIIILIFAIMKELLDLATKDASLAALCLTVSQRIAKVIFKIMVLEFTRII